ncbi:MAG: ribonuclease E activity regulator RraA [Gammaproteobacteria bacterium]|nr:ribonuclease E activity regulator RraA [Gammaproteobacteria bacterium]MBL6999138.1 ribonuclease E activity regulator RraA [Gammaproteobacteria bacterium]
MSTINFKTADLCDDYSDQLEIVEPGYLSFGGLAAFYGPVSTIKCFEDNSKVREQLSEPGHGRVLVVDAGGSKRCAMLGDLLAQKGVDNGWAGVIMYGLIRDSDDISRMPIGVKALGTHPKKSEKKNMGFIDMSVTFSGVTFKPGDYVYADHDGIILSHTELPLK